MGLGFAWGEGFGVGLGMFPCRWSLLLAGGVAGGLGAVDFPEPYNSEKRPGAPMPAVEAAGSFRMPDGFSVTVFASEPEVRQPVSMAFDFRGRLWVAENYTYAESGVNFAPDLRDRVVILEDRDGDGRAEVRKVFWDGGRILTSVEPTHDGAFVLCPPRLLFVPDRNRDDVPDGEPEVLLDGFETTTGNRHTFANGLKTGPDGWLWGRIGISSGARIGVPGRPDSERVELRGGIWRYHPGRRVFEAVSHGTTNPWGLDWNEVGEPFFINTVIGHLWHAIPGAHFQRMHGDDVMGRAYALMAQHADHLHFDVGAGWTKSRADGVGAVPPGIDALGGGHAHAGLMIYQGTNWPAAYRGGMYTLNLHGRRVNRERLERLGSGYVGRHEPDFLTVGDAWFRGIEIMEGPDGGVYIADWSDTGECHEHDGVHRSSGRIYKVTHGSGGGVAVPDFERMSEPELAERVMDRNEWVSRMARRVLATRAGSDTSWSVAAGLRGEFLRQKESRDALRALWAVHGLGGATPDWLVARTGDDDEHVRSWAVRLLAEKFAVDMEADGGPCELTLEQSARVQQRFVRMAAQERSALVRLYLGSALQRLPASSRFEVASGLVSRAEDAADPNLGLLIWYGIEPLAVADPDGLGKLGEISRMPVVRRHVARRLTEEMLGNPGVIDGMVGWAAGRSAAEQGDVVVGMAEALRGWRRADAPKSWGRLVAAVKAGGDAGLMRRVQELEVVFGDGRASAELMAVAKGGGTDALSRRAAVRSLLEARVDGVGELLRGLAGDAEMRLTALVALQELGDPKGPELAIQHFQYMALEDRAVLLTSMGSRPAGARAVLEAIRTGRVLKAAVSAHQVRQMARLGDPEVSAGVAEFWGSVAADGARRRVEIGQWKERLGEEVLRKADLGRGRRVFGSLCASCHRLYGEGGEVGPDLTGSGRASLEYLLENVVDPGAVVADEQRLTVVTMRDGRVLSGMLREAGERTLTLVMPGERVVLARAEVGLVETLDQSAMPEGLIDAVSVDEVRDLMGYLMHPRQVPMDGGR